VREPFLDHFFKPQAVAVVGASPREASFGLTLVNNLKKGGFPGKIYPINPKHLGRLEFRVLSFKFLILRYRWALPTNSL
jgi:acyl-CoA synthetase (NDP forming)